jgi:ferredoxin
MSSNSIHVTVMAEHCAGAGHCRALAPDVFGSDGDEWVAILDEHPDPSRLEAVLSARSACPMGIIEVHDEHHQSLP